jgi:hypothetical protein
MTLDAPLQTESAPAVDVAPAPVVEAPAPAVDATQSVASPAVEADAPVTAVSSLLSETVETPAVEATEPQPDSETAPAEAPPAVEFTDFTLPEGVQLDDTSLNTFKEVLGGELPPQEKGQRLVDMYIAEINKRDQAASDNQYKVWNETQAQWKEQVKADPELGGNRFNTTLQTCIGAINQYGGTEAQVAELKQALTFTGAGSHPAIIRWANNMASALKEGSPMATTAAPKPPQSRAQKRYNASGAN